MTAQAVSMAARPTVLLPIHISILAIVIFYGQRFLDMAKAADILPFEEPTIFSIRRIKERLRRKDPNARCLMLEMHLRILVGLLAFSDLFCIVSELQNATRTLLHVQSYRRECFWAISSYLVMTEVQGLLMTALAFDRLFAFAYPFKYVSIGTPFYVTCCCIPAILQSISFLIAGAVNLDDQPIPACNPPLAYVPAVSKIWGYGGIIIALVTLSFFVLALITILIKVKNLRRGSQYSSEYQVLQTQRNLSTSCTVMLIVFLLTTFASHVAIAVADHWSSSKEVANSIQTNVVIFMMISYAQPYYVYFFCSKLYREAFKAQICYILPRRIGAVLHRKHGVTVFVTGSRP
uniref:G_PROTEIN_RECEP_F1_2 domain-containing protein n=1 Tax=Steinernema glaseri TaxID=37863 RepID=A0A1I7Z636_9BILA